MAGTATLCVHKSDRTEVLSFGKTFYETYKVKNHDNNGLGGYTESNYYLPWEKFMQKNMSYQQVQPKYWVGQKVHLGFTYCLKENPE